MTQNPAFRNWARAATFSISMTEPAIRELLFMYGCRLERPAGCTDYGYYINSRQITSYLARRGLIVRCQERTCEDNHVLTTAGCLLAQLLVEAGFSVHLGCIQVPRPESSCSNSSSVPAGAEPPGSPGNYEN